MNDYTSYQSPLQWRYASPEMRTVWSEVNKRKLWRQVWVALAETQMELGLVSLAQVNDLRAHQDEIDMERSLAIESEIHHDLMAEVKAFAEQSPIGGGIIHLGATSMDIEDNADAMRLKQSTQIILSRLTTLLLLLADRVETFASTPVIGMTHLQPAEPVTLGYRLAFTAQDLLTDWQNLSQIFASIKGKGFKGAVGTAASYMHLLGAENFDNFEAILGKKLDLSFFDITHQTYPRKQDFTLISALASIGLSLYKFAFDLRLLQSPYIGEEAEPFGKLQVGSSAMPFKRNPIQSEKINSLARTLSGLPALAWQNAAHSLLERTLDDSANRRMLLPEAFLLCDELLLTTLRVVSGIQINEPAILKNLRQYAPFAGVEPLLMALTKAGADRQHMHEHLRELSMQAWSHVAAGNDNPLVSNAAADKLILRYLSETQIRDEMNIEHYLGISADRSRDLAVQIRQTVGDQDRNRDSV